MNLSSKYKFVDDCKDAFDKILELISLDSGPQTFKDDFFKNVALLSIAEMYKSLPQDIKIKVKPIFQSNDFIEISETFLPHFSEDVITKIYKSSFKTLTEKAFLISNLVSIHPKVNEILATLDSPVPSVAI